jgi:hypothetical protein
MDMNQEIDTHAMSELFNIFEEEVSSSDIPDAVREILQENENLKEHLEEDNSGYAGSPWFMEKLDKHIKFHLSGDSDSELVRGIPSSWGYLGINSLEELVTSFETLKKEVDEKDQYIESHDEHIGILETENQKLQEELDMINRIIDMRE